MASDIFEEIVVSWLQVKRYFVMSNIKYGNNQEIDILATKINTNEVIHIEVSCSSNPISVFGTNIAGNQNYKRNAADYLEKKYFNQKVNEKIKELTEERVKIDRQFIHGKLREPKQLLIFEKSGVKTIYIGKVIKDIQGAELRSFSGDKRIKQLLDIAASVKN